MNDSLSDKEPRSWRKKDAEGDDLIEVWRRRPAHSEERLAVEIIEQLEGELTEARKWRGVLTDLADRNQRRVEQLETALPSLAATETARLAKELRMCVAFMLDKYPHHTTMMKTLTEAASALESAPPSPQAAPDALVKIDDGQSTHCRTAKEWLDLARADLARRSHTERRSTLSYTAAPVPPMMKIVPHLRPRPDHVGVDDMVVLASDYFALKEFVRDLLQATFDPENQPSQFGTHLSAIEPTVRVGLWPMLVQGQIATDAKGILLMIDSEQSDEEKAITLWHETLHLLGLTDEDHIEILAKQLAGAAPKILDFVRRADDSAAGRKA